jgi:hypothetical protein
MQLWDGEYLYSDFDDQGNYTKEAQYGSGTIDLTIDNTLPEAGGDLGDNHMNNVVDGIDLFDFTSDADNDPLEIVDSGADIGSLVKVGNTWTYTPADGYVDGDTIDLKVWDGENRYTNFDDQGNYTVAPQYVSGIVTINMTNELPTASGDLGSTESGTTLIVGQTDTTSPVLVIDIPDLPQQTIDDVLSIPNGTYTGNAGGTLIFDGTDWIYKPTPGFVGEETFQIDVWDGQYDYANIEVREPVYGLGTVTVTVGELPPPPPTPTPTPVLELAPVAPLADYEIPRLVGCPAEMEAAANELATNSDQLQLLIANAMATNPNLQPCDACANLLTAATVLKQMDNQHIAALAQIFNSQAPIDAPFTPEVSASVVTAFANFREMETELAIMTAEQYEQYQQYALADELIDAFVSYVAVLENDLKLPVGDAMALVMDKYGEAIEATGNANILAYLIAECEYLSLSDCGDGSGPYRKRARRIR